MYSIPETVIPILFPVWARVDHVLGRPLASKEVVENAPIFAYMTEQNGQVTPIPPQSDVDWAAMDYAALQYLNSRPGEWKSEELELETGSRRLVVACEDDPFACARIIDGRFMSKAHDMLQANQLIVSIPVQGVLYATRADMNRDDLERYADLIYQAYTDTQFHPVSPILFLMEDGEITQAVAGTEQASTPVQRPLPVQVDQVDSPSGGYAVEMQVKKIPPISSRISELTRAVENVIRSELDHAQFGGQITLYVNTGSDTRIPADEVEQEFHLLEARLERMLEKGDYATLNGQPVKVNVVHVQPDEQSTRMESRSTGSLTGSLLQAQDPSERAKSAEILGKRADLDAIRPLVAALEDEDGQVRESAIEALLRIGEPSVGFLEYFAESASVLGRVNALTALRRMEAGRFISLFLRAAEHPDAQIREQAALAMVDVKDEALQPTMFKFLQDESSVLRRMAVRWLGAFQTDWALDGLIDALADVDDEVRQEARQAIVARGKPVTETLRARRKLLDRNRQPVLYEEMSDVLEEIGGGNRFLGLFKRG